MRPIRRCSSSGITSLRFCVTEKVNSATTGIVYRIHNIIYKYKIIQNIKYTEAILSNSTRKLLWFEITKMLIAALKNMVLFIIIFGTLT